jgi:hypothetical protein
MQTEPLPAPFRHAAGTRWLPVAEAARQLGLSERGLRGRITRGQALAQQTAAGWRVAVPEPLPEPPDSLPEPVTEASGTVTEPPWRELVDVLEATVGDLRGRLDTSEQANSELRRLLALALQRPALPAPTLDCPEPDSPRPWWAALRWWRR